MFGLFKSRNSRPANDTTRIADGVEKTVKETIPLVAEELVVETREVEGDTVRVDVRTRLDTQTVNAELMRDAIDVKRVPVDRAVSTLPATRTEGDTTIIPVMRERLVLKRELVLVEEIHITHARDRVTVEREVELRSQYPEVSRRAAPVAEQSSTEVTEPAE